MYTFLSDTLFDFARCAQGGSSLLVFVSPRSPSVPAFLVGSQASRLKGSFPTRNHSFPFSFASMEMPDYRLGAISPAVSIFSFFWRTKTCRVRALFCFSGVLNPRSTSSQFCHEFLSSVTGGPFYRFSPSESGAYFPTLLAVLAIFFPYHLVFTCSKGFPRRTPPIFFPGSLGVDTIL